MRGIHYEFKERITEKVRNGLQQRRVCQAVLGCDISAGQTDPSTLNIFQDRTQTF